MKPLSLEVEFKATKKNQRNFITKRVVSKASPSSCLALLAHTFLTFPTSGYPGRHRFPHQRLGGAASRPLLPLPQIRQDHEIVQVTSKTSRGKRSSVSLYHSSRIIAWLQCPL